MQTDELSAPCAHIADYYQRQWEQQPCIAYNLLRQGYRQWADGRVKHWANDLFGETLQ